MLQLFFRYENKYKTSDEPKNVHCTDTIKDKKKTKIRQSHFERL